MFADAHLLSVPSAKLCMHGESASSVVDLKLLKTISLYHICSLGVLVVGVCLCFM